MKKPIDILVISDLHLGTFGSRANAFLAYLDTIDPQKIIINGDLIDIWQFVRWYFPKSHLRVIQRLIQYIAAGVPVYYLTGNHDDLLRRFTPLQLGNFQLLDELSLDLNGARTWILHGDIYDKTIKARTAAILGGFAYHTLIVADRLINKLRRTLGARRPWRISKGLKDFSKRAAKKVGDFEQDAIDNAIERQYDYLICGHIHKPQHRTAPHSTAPQRQIQYLNSGDWVENMTALEYTAHNWQLVYFDNHAPHQSATR